MVQPSFRDPVEWRSGWEAPNYAGHARCRVENGVDSYRNRTTGESQNNTQFGDVYELLPRGTLATKTQRLEGAPKLD